ncbi:MAG: DUF2059 domain-containing protein [Pseudohongiellaceae bacterium]
MQADEKLQFVERLVELTLGNLASEPDPSTSTNNEFANALREKFRQQQIDLRMKYFEPEQIVALLEFYDTPMGRSILQKQAKIEQEIASNVSVISNAAHN